LQIGIGVADGFDEEAGVGIAGNNGRAFFAAFEEAVAELDGKIAFEFFGAGAVAFVTVVNKNWTDFVLEKLELGGGGGGGPGGEGT
jgi:hypothetical protein